MVTTMEIGVKKSGMDAVGNIKKKYPQVLLNEVVI